MLHSYSFLCLKQPLTDYVASTSVWSRALDVLSSTRACIGDIAHACWGGRFSRSAWRKSDPARLYLILQHAVCGIVWQFTACSGTPAVSWPFLAGGAPPWGCCQGRFHGRATVAYAYQTVAAASGGGEGPVCRPQCTVQESSALRQRGCAVWHMCLIGLLCSAPQLFG